MRNYPISQRKRTLLPGEKMSRTRQMRGGATAEREKREEVCLARAPPPPAEFTGTVDAQSSAHTGTPPLITADLPYRLTA